MDDPRRSIGLWTVYVFGFHPASKASVAPSNRALSSAEPPTNVRNPRILGVLFGPSWPHRLTIKLGNEVFDSRKWRIPGPVSVSQCSRKEKECRISEGLSWPHTLSGQTSQYPQPGTGGLPLGECCFDTICFDVYLQHYKSSEVFDILALAKRTCNDIDGWPEGSPRQPRLVSCKGTGASVIR